MVFVKGVFYLLIVLKVIYRMVVIIGWGIDVMIFLNLFRYIRKLS